MIEVTDIYGSKVSLNTNKITFLRDALPCINTGVINLEVHFVGSDYIKVKYFEKYYIEQDIKGVSAETPLT